MTTAWEDNATKVGLKIIYQKTKVKQKGDGLSTDQLVFKVRLSCTVLPTALYASESLKRS